MTETIPAVQSGHQIHQLPLTEISGEEVAARFPNEAYEILEQRELKQLRDFFSLHPRHIPSRDELHENVTRRLQIFYEIEVLESGEDGSRLACPSGPEDAELGLIMHCQSKDGEEGPFWDMTNASIQALAAKGLSEDFTFCYDWQWRAESSPLGRGLCPAKT